MTTIQPMDFPNRTILITGGASGIGFALAERFVAAGAKVVICGRRRQKLEEARAKLPSIATRTCDLASPAGRREFAREVIADFPALDVLVNNAGIQTYPGLAGSPDWSKLEEELATNLAAPIHLATLLLPHIAQRPGAAIVNVTSGLAFAPMARAPVYSATKAALRSFTLTLRRQLAGTSVRVVELIPPAVDTDLGGPGLHTFGVPVAEFADAAMAGLVRGDLEIAHGFAAEASRASRPELDQMFERMNAPR